MNGFNRVVAIVLWFVLLLVAIVVAVDPIGAVLYAQQWLGDLAAWLNNWKTTNPTNFLIAQIAAGMGAVTLFAMLLWGEIVSMRRRGVRIYTAEGGSAMLDIDSVGRRLAWHLDQLAEVMTVAPNVRSRGSAVDIRLEIEAAPDVDIPLKTEEVVQVTREIIEQELGLRMGKLDVHMRCAPFDPEWAG
jgi:hypothetical protein